MGQSQLTWKERSDNLVTTPWTWKKHSDNPMKTSSECHAIFSVHATLVLLQSRFWLRRYRVNTIVIMSSWRPHGGLVRLRPLYVNFEHVQCSSTSSASMETISRPNRFILRSHDVVQVLVASWIFLWTCWERGMVLRVYNPIYTF